MNYSSASGRKSKYQESSKKVSELFEEFQQLQQRINTPKPQTCSLNDIFSPPLPIKSSEKKLGQNEKKNRSMEARQHLTQELQNKYLLRKKFQKHLTEYVHDVSFLTRQKMMCLEKRFSKIQMSLKIILDRLKLKFNQKKTVSSSLWKGMNAKQTSEIYEEKIKVLVEMYEHKISLMIKETSSNDTSTSSKVLSVDKILQKGIRISQDDFIAKQKQITEVKVQNSKLRRQNEKYSSILKSKENIINELTQQVTEKKKQIEKVIKTLKSYENENKKIRNINYFCGNQLKKDYELIKFVERKSSHSRLNPTHLQISKELKAKKAEIELLMEEGAATEYEKNRFEQQLRQYQADEQKFQKQNAIFKSQIKRMNFCIKNLDDCAVKILLEGKLSSQLLKNLDPESRLKRQYEKKMTQRSDSRHLKKK